MTAGFRLSSPPAGIFAALTIAAAVLAIAVPGPASSQQPNREDFLDLKESDCERIPGGNAPIQRIARVEGGLSVRNLELTYLEKPLHALTQQDLEYLRALWPFCATFEEPVANLIADQLAVLLDDAKSARQQSLDWISEVEAQVSALPPGEDSIRTIHDLWQQMLNREFEMLKSDLHYLAGVLSEKRNELYRSEQERQRTLIKPFDPGPPVTRDLSG